jgi:hypothetical protein
MDLTFDADVGNTNRKESLILGGRVGASRCKKQETAHRKGLGLTAKGEDTRPPKEKEGCGK